MKNTSKEDLLAERPNLDWSKAVRGRYSNLFAEGTNIAILDPTLLPYFPNSQSVNAALQAFLSLPAEQRATALRQATAKLHPEEDTFDRRIRATTPHPRSDLRPSKESAESTTSNS